MQNSQISFTSRIRLVTKSDFKSVASKVSANVDYPWTAKEIIKSNSAYTTGICDCTAGGITDGKDVVMFHICPSESNLNDWSNIIGTLKQKIDIKSKKLQGFLLGSFVYSRSNSVFCGFEAFMKENKVPYTKLQGHTEIFADSDILYSSSRDEWLVTSDQISCDLKNNRKLFGKMSIEERQKQLAQIVKNTFLKVNIAPKDKLVFSNHSGRKIEVTNKVLKYLFAQS